MRWWRVCRIGCSGMILALLACDPGIDIAPAEWTQTDSATWVGRVGLIVAETGRIGGLVGNEWASVRIRFENPTLVPVAIDSIALAAGTEVFTARTFSTGAEAYGPFVLDAGQSDVVRVSWEFEGIPLFRLFERECEVRFFLRTDSTGAWIGVPYRVLDPKGS